MFTKILALKKFFFHLIIGEAIVPNSTFSDDGLRKILTPSPSPSPA